MINYKLVFFFIFIFYAKNFLALKTYSNKRLNEWTVITAHNANLNWEDSKVLPNLANQKFSIDKQISFGVRGFMVDIDWKVCSAFEKFFKSCSCEGVCMCHGPCDSSLFKDGFDIKPFSYILKKMVNFLKRNPDEIITLFLENYIVDSSKLLSIYESVDDLTNLLFDPYYWNVTELGWPKIADMISANKRLLIIDDEKRGFHVDYIRGLIRSRDFVLQNRYEWTKDKYEWPLAKMKNESLNENNKTSVSIIMPRCCSVHNVQGKPLWDENRPLNHSAKEHVNQVVHGEKLFLFNNFYGIQIAKFIMDPFTLKLMNDKDFIFKRIVERCNAGTRGIKPTHIALDFVNQFEVQNILNHFNN